MTNIDDIERALARSTTEPEDLEDQGFWTEARVIAIFPDMIAEIRELRTENARLREDLTDTKAEYHRVSEAFLVHARAALGEPQ